MANVPARLNDFNGNGEYDFELASRQLTGGLGGLIYQSKLKKISRNTAREIAEISDDLRKKVARTEAALQIAMHRNDAEARLRECKLIRENEFRELEIFYESRSYQREGDQILRDFEFAVQAAARIPIESIREQAIAIASDRFLRRLGSLSNR